MVNMYDMNLIANLAQQSGSKGGGASKAPMGAGKPTPAQPEAAKPADADPMAQPTPISAGPTGAGSTDLAPMGQEKAPLFDTSGNDEKMKQMGLLKSMWA